MVLTSVKCSLRSWHDDFCIIHLHCHFLEELSWMLCHLRERINIFQCTNVNFHNKLIKSQAYNLMWSTIPSVEGGSVCTHLYLSVGRIKVRVFGTVLFVHRYEFKFCGLLG